MWGAGTWEQCLGVWEKGATCPLEEVGQEAVVLSRVLPCWAGNPSSSAAGQDQAE